MIIAFTGAHRVGKTSLAEEIAKNLPHYELKNEPYLQMEEMGYLFLDIPILDDYILQFNQSVKQLETCGNDVIFDRCPLDILAYLYAISEKKSYPPFLTTC
jgi:predicted ATPase